MCGLEPLRNEQLKNFICCPTSNNTAKLGIILVNEYSFWCCSFHDNYFIQSLLEAEWVCAMCFPWQLYSYNLCWRHSGCVPRVFHDNYIHTIFVGGTVGVCHVFSMTTIFIQSLLEAQWVCAMCLQCWLLNIVVMVTTQNYNNKRKWERHIDWLKLFLTLLWCCLHDNKIFAHS